MSTLSQFLGGSGGAGNHTSDPKQLGRYICPPGVLATLVAASENLSNAAGFFTADATAATNAPFVADTYQTLVNVTNGSGFLSAVVGPSQNTTGQTMTVRFTVDGVVTVVPLALGSPGLTVRGVLGRLRPRSVSATDPRNLMGDAGRSGSGGLAVVPLGTGAIVVTPTIAQAWGIGMLRYNKSLLVEVKNSAAISGTTNMEQQAAAFYTVE